LISAALLIESPGRLGAVLIPPSIPYGLKREATVAVLKEMKCCASRDSLAVLQSLLGAEDTEQAALYADAGFEFLAELVYLERPASAASPRFKIAEEPEFAPFTPDTEHLFLHVLGETYRASLDCPPLAGVRRTEDVLATHRATGIFDSNNWQLASLRGRLAGILLLAGVPGRRAYEIVYVGVVPEARGRGVGDALLARAVEVCRRGGEADLTLAVDSNNRPACRLYRRWSFREVQRRQAWFCAVPTAMTNR
jgi:ribosomal protein S18 acetylase RimI-like enzyme